MSQVMGRISQERIAEKENLAIRDAENRRLPPELGGKGRGPKMKRIYSFNRPRR